MIVQSVTSTQSVFLEKEANTSATVTTVITAMERLAHVCFHFCSSIDALFLADSENRRDTLFVARGMAIFQRGTKLDVPGKQVSNHKTSKNLMAGL